MHKQHLVLVVMNNRRQLRPAPDQIPRRELALENRILKMIPKPAHGLEYLPQPLIVGNVVANQIGLSHGSLFLVVK